MRLDDTAKAIVAAFKYRSERRLASWMAEHMAELVPATADLLTWAPATPERRRSRGYDQGQELALALAGHTGLPVCRLLKRDRRDSRLTGRSRDARADGPKLIDAGSVAPGAMIVVVDDVVTSGATIASASAHLRARGAARCVAVTFASTPRVRSEGPSSRFGRY